MERSGQSVPVLWGRRSLGSTELSVSNPQELEARGGRTRTVEPLQQHDPIDRTHHEDGDDSDVVAWVVRSESLEEEMRAIAKAIIQRAVGAGPGRLPRGVPQRNNEKPPIGLIVLLEATGVEGVCTETA